MDCFDDQLLQFVSSGHILHCCSIIIIIIYYCSIIRDKVTFQMCTVRVKCICCSLCESF